MPGFTSFKASADDSALTTSSVSGDGPAPYGSLSEAEPVTSITAPMTEAPQGQKQRVIARLENWLDAVRKEP